LAKDHTFLLVETKLHKNIQIIKKIIIIFN